MPEDNPFAVLSFIVAPAILTNAASLLTMSTSNRLARAVDRARDLSKQLESCTDYSDPQSVRRLAELDANQRRAGMLVAALQRFYLAIGAFALAALVSLLGAALAFVAGPTIVRTLELAAVAAGFVAVGALVSGSATLVRETRIALGVVRQRAEEIQRRASEIGGGQ
jgi:hypothetical protein